MAERSKSSPSSSRRITKLKFKPKPPNPKKNKARATSSIQPQAEDKPAIDKDILEKLRTRSAIRKTAAPTGEDGNNEQKPRPSPQGDLHAETKNENKYGPYIVLPMRPDNTNSEELNKQEFGQTSLISSETKASINSVEVLGLEKENEQNRMLLFQFPKSLPYEVQQPNAEEDGKGKMKPKTVGCNLQQLPAGYVGKMLVYKSGKVKMKLGDVIFDVNPGVTRNFEEHAVAINTKEGHLCKLGNIEQHSAVVTPDVDTLLEGTKN